MCWDQKGVFLTDIATEMMDSNQEERFRREVTRMTIINYERDLYKNTTTGVKICMGIESRE